MNYYCSIFFYMDGLEFFWWLLGMFVKQPFTFPIFILHLFFFLIKSVLLGLLR